MAYARIHEEMVQGIDPALGRWAALTVSLVEAVDRMFCAQLDERGGVYQGAIAEFLADTPGHLTHQYSVLRVREGVGEEIPYHKEYAPLVGEVCAILRELEEEVNRAGRVRLDARWWRSYYAALRHSFLTDEWEVAERAFLDFDPSNPFLLSVGPIERYNDKTLGTKRYYSALFMNRNEQYGELDALWHEILRL